MKNNDKKKLVNKKDNSLISNKSGIFKTIGIVIGVLALFVLVFFSSTLRTGNGLKPIVIDTNVAEYFELKKGDVPSIILFARNGCDWCSKYKPVIYKISSEYELPIYYVNTQKMTQDEYDSVVFDSPYATSEGGFGTPLTLIVGNNEELGYIDGYEDYNKVIEVFKNSGVIE